MIGYVYKIVHKQLPICYIGSTTKTLAQRWQAHRNSFTAWCKGCQKISIAIYQHMDEHGMDNFDMILIRECEVADRAHLLAIEQLYINKLSTINVAHAFNPFARTKNSEARKQQHLDAYKKNRNKIRADYATKIMCECRREVCKGNLKKHRTQRKHLIRMDTIAAYS